MSFAEVSAEPARRAEAGERAHDGRQSLMVVLMWACVAGGAGIAGFAGAIDGLTTDDAMRLAEVRDLLAGQSWFDLVQHRLNPLDGVLMHWSRVIDLPIALLLGLAQTFLPADVALKTVLVLWPALLLLAALFACSSASRTLAGPLGATLGPLMMLLSPGVTSRFGPSAIDHHGAQIALALAMLACALKADVSRRAAAGAGVAAALMLAIGMETLPHVAAIAGLVALRWAVEGAPAAEGAKTFGLSFAIATVATALVTLAPSVWSAPVCDALGAGHLAAAVSAGAGLWAAASWSRGELPARLVACAGISVVVLAAVALTAPDCLAAPYAGLPERLKQDWLATVQEAQPFLASAATDPTGTLIIGLPLLALAGVAAWAATTARGAARWPVWMAAGAFFAGCAVTLWQVRGASLAYAFAAPLLPMAVVAIGKGGAERARLVLGVMALSPMSLALLGLGISEAVGMPPLAAVELREKLCPAEQYRALGRLQPGLALNTIDTGPYILAHTPHSAVAAPYHRNVDGLIAAIDAFDGEEETARAVAISRRAAYIVACTTDGGVTPASRAKPDGFSAKLLSGARMDWLEPVDLGPGSHVKAWRVTVGRR
ncbi:hypothetical protein IHQ68_18475 [Chelatococcus sambhunathii]|uniref:Uncharacterized protein n=1 Tax=Chelatococcus sambhunathii TaxID=363953 RepID=A0ABU1DKH0_9HYPH|nr:hypothetical protein [Chelatococcus sambhunathii]MDR4308610.1 hypothetical protein [Chelatococcus sambhunathii]